MHSCSKMTCNLLYKRASFMLFLLFLFVFAQPLSLSRLAQLTVRTQKKKNKAISCNGVMKCQRLQKCFRKSWASAVFHQHLHYLKVIQNICVYMRKYCDILCNWALPERYFSYQDMILLSCIAQHHLMFK